MIISRGFICELHLKMLKNSRKLKIAGGPLELEQGNVLLVGHLMKMLTCIKEPCFMKDTHFAP